MYYTSQIDSIHAEDMKTTSLCDQSLYASQINYSLSVYMQLGYIYI